MKTVWTRSTTTAIAAGLLMVATVSPALATDRRQGTEPFRFPGTTPFPTGEHFRFPGTTPLPGVVPPSRVTSPTTPPGNMHDGRQHHDHQHRRAPVIIIQPPPVYYYVPRPAGSWSYRWVPRYVEVPVWVPGHWAPDGQWIAGHYQSRWSDYGAWEPYWVPSY